MKLTKILPGSSISYVYGNGLIPGLKAEKKLRNKNDTADWALGYHPGDNGHMTN